MTCLDKRPTSNSFQSTRSCLYPKQQLNLCSACCDKVQLENGWSSRQCFQHHACRSRACCVARLGKTLYQVTRGQHIWVGNARRREQKQCRLAFHRRRRRMQTESSSLAEWSSHLEGNSWSNRQAGRLQSKALLFPGCKPMNASASARYLGILHKKIKFVTADATIMHLTNDEIA